MSLRNKQPILLRPSDARVSQPPMLYAGGRGGVALHLVGRLFFRKPRNGIFLFMTCIHRDFRPVCRSVGTSIGSARLGQRDGKSIPRG